MVQRLPLPNALILSYTYTMMRWRTTNSDHTIAVQLIAIRTTKSEYRDQWTEEKTPVNEDKEKYQRY
jgi:hypothetical protein